MRLRFYCRSCDFYLGDTYLVKVFSYIIYMQFYKQVCIFFKLTMTVVPIFPQNFLLWLPVSTIPSLFPHWVAQLPLFSSLVIVPLWAASKPWQGNNTNPRLLSGLGYNWGRVQQGLGLSSRGTKRPICPITITCHSQSETFLQLLIKLNNIPLK